MCAAMWRRPGRGIGAVTDRVAGSMCADKSVRFAAIDVTAVSDESGPQRIGVDFQDLAFNEFALFTAITLIGPDIGIHYIVHHPVQ